MTFSTRPQPLERLAGGVRLALDLEQSADRLIDSFVAEARDAGCSWAQIGVTLGVTKQAAQQRFVTRMEPLGQTAPDYLDTALTTSSLRDRMKHASSATTSTTLSSRPAWPVPDRSLALAF